MKRPRTIAIVVLVCAGLLSTAPVQAQAPAQVSPAELGEVSGYNSLYCSGFISDRVLQEGLFVMAGGEAGDQYEFATGDIVFLSKGTGWIVNPDGEYIVYRRTKDLIRQEAFPGQKRMLKQLGTMYMQVGRIKINIVHRESATAQVLHACESITAGDFLIPFDVKAAVPLKPAAGFDRFAPASGRTVGTIVTGKEYASLLGTGDIAYLDIGSNHGVAIGQNYRIFRPFGNSDRRSTHPDDLVHAFRGQAGGHLLTNPRYPTHIMGKRMGLRLNRSEQQRLPRGVLGELVILHVEPRSATGLLSFSQKEIFAGDQVELE